MRAPIVFDLETKHTFREFSDPKDLGITVAGIYDYKTDTSYTFLEHELNEFFRLIEDASCLIGFNIIGFDLPVLSAYYPGDVNQFTTFDLLADIKDKIGRRISLDILLKATLQKQKTGHGLQAVEFYNEGKIEELKSYCLHDVLFTKELFEYGCLHREVFYFNGPERRSIEVSWNKHKTASNAKTDISLTLPF